jgi:phosphatidate phosphatase PAH1
MLSGAMDILVIEEPKGEYRSSAFHVRFGSLKVLRSEEQDIDIYINGRKRNVKMKLANRGDAYFLFDELDPYMIRQSKQIRDREFNNNQILLMDKITGKRESKDDKILKRQYKSVFPSSNQLKALELAHGQNEIRFVCRTSPSGVQTLSSHIYLWHYTSKVIITDVDGTITKSDILGQVLPFFGRDWSHPGVTALFRNLYNNGYKIVYLTARAIGQSEFTKNYLTNLVQNNISLPPGPLFMSPDGIFTSLRREVIEKKPHLLKVPLLIELKNLFPTVLMPFYAGFGNRETDAISYRYVNIPLNRCFIINTSSEVIQLGSTVKTTYQEIADNIDKDFKKLPKGYKIEMTEDEYYEENENDNEDKDGLNRMYSEKNNNSLDDEGNSIKIETSD